MALSVGVGCSERKWNNSYDVCMSLSVGCSEIKRNNDYDEWL